MRLKRWIKIAIFLVCTGVSLFLAITLLCVANEKDAVGVYGFYKEPQDSLDVVLIGPSSIYTAFYSPLAYEEQGITSYALSTSTMPASLYRYAAEIAVTEQHPQLLVFDTWSFCYDVQLDETSLRKFLDALPASEIKERAIEELVPAELQESFRYPFQKYHSSWDRFGELVQVLRDKLDMNRQGYSITKNYATTPAIQEYRKQGGKYKVSEAGLKYLQELLTYLQEAGVSNALFIRVPEMTVYEPTESYQQMIDMIRNAGFDFLNMNAAVEDMKLDRERDYYNMTHLNVFGAKKFTSFLADYVVHRYVLKTDHEETVTTEWRNCASYNAPILSRLEELTLKNANGFLYTQRDFLIER